MYVGSSTSIRTVCSLRLLRPFILFLLLCGLLECQIGALEALKKEAAEHDSELKGLKKAKDRATKVTD